MLRFPILLVFLAVVATANKLAGKYQALFFYHIYRLDVDAYGLENCHMAPGCRKNNGVCDLEAFMRYISAIKENVVLDSKGDPIKNPETGKFEYVMNPDFDEVDWGNIDEGDEKLENFSTEIDKSGFQGSVYNEKIFKDWGSTQNSFNNVMSKAEEITTNAISQIRADGREPDKDRTQRLLTALKTHANARRCDQAQVVTQKFVDFMTNKGKGYTVALTTINEPPIPQYDRIDVDQTILDNQGKAGFNSKLEQTVRDFVGKENKSKDSLKHVNPIKKALSVYNNLAQACGSA
jgi:hypothetical protein